MIDSIIIYPKPDVNFINPTGDAACLNDTVSFLYNCQIPIIPGVTGQNINSVIWEVTSPSGVVLPYTLASLTADLQIIVNEPGYWNVKITVGTNVGCSDFYKDSILVYTLPTADFTILPDSSCFGYGLTYFDANSSIWGSAGQIITYNWDFTTNANLPTANGIIASANFTINGNWLIDLIVIDNFGCSDDTTKPLVINNSMTAYFEATTECFGDSTCFDSEYPFSSPNANSWYWEFGDGNTSTLQNPCHQYNAPGNYSVTLTVWDNTYADSSYCIGSFTDTTVHVRELPIANFSADIACFLDATQFTDLSLAVEP